MFGYKKAALFTCFSWAAAFHCSIRLQNLYLTSLVFLAVGFIWLLLLVLRSGVLHLRPLLKRLRRYARSIQTDNMQTISYF